MREPGREGAPPLYEGGWEGARAMLGLCGEGAPGALGGARMEEPRMGWRVLGGGGARELAREREVRSFGGGRDIGDGLGDAMHWWWTVGYRRCDCVVWLWKLRRSSSEFEEDVVTSMGV